MILLESGNRILGETVAAQLKTPSDNTHTDTQTEEEGKEGEQTKPNETQHIPEMPATAMSTDEMVS